MYSALSNLNTMTEVPLSKAPNPELLLNEGTHNLKKYIKLDGGNVEIRLNWNKECGV